MASSARKIEKSDLEEGFPALLKRAEEGFCVIPGCGNHSELIHYASHENPILCYAHQEDGSLQHYGSYLPTPNPYYHQWSCCPSSWKLSSCSKLHEKFAGLQTIPRTERQLKNLEERLEFFKQQQEENEKYERMMNFGREERYDR